MPTPLLLSVLEYLPLSDKKTDKFLLMPTSLPKRDLHPPIKINRYASGIIYLSMYVLYICIYV